MILLVPVNPGEAALAGVVVLGYEFIAIFLKLEALEVVLIYNDDLELVIKLFIQLACENWLMTLSPIKLQS